MSVHALVWAWRQKVGHPTRKLVLVALADEVIADDGECWPSLERIAEFAECDVRTVQRHIDVLMEEGFVQWCQHYQGYRLPHADNATHS